MVKTQAELLQDSKTRTMEALAGVADPEIPAVSVLDLGMIENIDIDGDHVTVTLLPTFVGCPAIEVIKEDITAALLDVGLTTELKVVYQPPWTSERITDEGKRKLKEYGLAPPTGRSTVGKVTLTLLKPGPCPYCGSSNTILESPFGPTACRATCYCRACRNPFEQFKNV